MSFPIKLTCNLPNYYFLVQKEEEELAPSSTVFLEKLENTLSIITDIAEASIRKADQKHIIYLHCSSPLFSSYVAQFPKGAENRIPWKVLKEGFSIESTLPMIRKLILFLQEEGCKRFPEMFKERSSPGFKAIKSSLKILYRLQQIEEGDLQPIPVTGSRKRKVFQSFKRPDTKKSRWEKAKTSPLIPCQVVSVIQEQDEEKNSELMQKEPVPLVSRSLELFDLEVYQGSDSEEDEMEAKNEAPKRIEEPAIEELMPVPIISQEVEEGATASIKIQNVIIPIFHIEKVASPRIPTFCFQYATKNYIDKQGAASFKMTLNRFFQNISNNIRLISKYKDSCITKWKEPFTDRNPEVVFNKNSLFLRALQGFEATRNYIQEKHPDLLEDKSKTNVKESLEEVIALLKEKLESVYPIVFENLARYQISDNSKLTPGKVLEELVIQKKIILEQVIAAKTTSPRIFTYLFFIQRIAYLDNNGFRISYKRLEYQTKKSNMMVGFRRSLSATLKNVDALLCCSRHLEFIDPMQGNTTEIQPLSSRLYEILLEGLKENYSYITKHASKIVKGKNSYLLTELVEKIQMIKRIQARPAYEADDEVEDISVSNNILSKLIKKENSSSSCISLESYLSQHRYRLSPTVLTTSYIFRIKKKAGYGHLLRYDQRKANDRKNFYTRCRMDILDTVNTVEAFLSKEPITAFFMDPFLQQASNVTQPEILWPAILEGLLEMKLFYQQHITTFLEPSIKFDPGKSLDAVISRILNEKSDLCKNPITKSSILSKLMSDFQQEEVVGPSGLQEIVLSDDES